jgi:hypothetical protein
VAGLRLVVRGLELVLLAAATRLWFQLLALLTAASLLLLLATLAALLFFLLGLIRHSFTPLNLETRQRCHRGGRS